MRSIDKINEIENKLIGYAKISTTDQNLNSPINALKKADWKKTEIYS